MDKQWAWIIAVVVAIIIIAVVSCSSLCGCRPNPENYLSNASDQLPYDVAVEDWRQCKVSEADFNPRP